MQVLIDYIAGWQSLMILSADKFLFGLHYTFSLDAYTNYFIIAVKIINL